ncbi:secreted protein [Legionella spiritensis]|uniref:Secreted protein n=2 Tax=Legionella spiritensis TaxID=452 RepID=A0A0W0ZB85_LEGSP|nr:secreted protein [Legionella spiritensis]SNV48627.1 secreted protein [Legionella spiritensis]VEG91530.1 secreted protein [Legionella spiritensis]
MAASDKTIYGYVEKATLVDKNLTLSAKLDTGAKSASLSAINIQEIEKDGKTYLRFIVPSKSGDVEFVSEYVGRVKIKVRAGERPTGDFKAKPIKRPVVMMRIRIGSKEHMIPVNLTNRKRFNYPLLLGRDAIKTFDGLIDPGMAFTIKNQTVE